MGEPVLWDRGDGVRLAYQFTPGRSPAVVFLPGFRSDMQGAKALEIQQFCDTVGQSCLRLDYSGHGASDGAFEDGTIGRWAEDARLAIAQAAPGPAVLVGSSMGGWIALLLARALGDGVVGFVGIAAAPDFTETMMWEAMAPHERALLENEGRLLVPSDYGDDLVITRGLIEDGRRHLVMGGPISLAGPVRLLQGQKDADVPWETALRLAERIEGADVQVTLIKDGDHRLSRPGDLRLLVAAVAGLLGGPLLGEDGA